MAEILIGTSGWQFDHWKGPVYPAGTPGPAMLGLYAKEFNTVEVNATFYGLPKPGTAAGWAAATPAGFVFACKGSRYLSHMKKLKDPGAAIARYFAALEGLGEKLGPVLFQLPPRWHANPGRLDAFLAALPPGRRYAFEFCDPSWFGAETRAILTRHRAALCIHDFGGRAVLAEPTADFVYLRLHGPHRPYRDSYGDDALAAWAGRIHDWYGDGRDVYCYFNNDAGGAAAADARALRSLLGQPGPG